MDFKLPELGEGVYEAELVAWLVKSGDTVKRGQNLMEVMTDKATMEVPSPFAGTIGSLYAEPGHTIKVGDAVLAYTAAGKAKEAAVATPVASRSEKPAAAVAETAVPPASRSGNGNATAAGERGLPIKAAPSVRYMARKLGIDLGRIRGTGPEGRIVIDDLAGQMPKIGRETETAPAEPRADYGKPGTRVKLTGLRRKVAEHMVVAMRTIPHYTYIDECEVTDLIRLREQLKEPFAHQGAKLTYLAFFVKAVVVALKEVPIVNSTLDEAANEIVLHKRWNIGIAVAAPGGLIVPVIHDADKKNLLDIARDIDRLSTDAKSGHAKLEDLRGGTFTITSIGGIGGLIATPVINHPEVGILGLGKVIKRPVYDANGNVRPADLIYLSLSLDHRVVDGAVGAAFANVIIRQLQNPAALLMQASGGFSPALPLADSSRPPG
jgi:pyruvate dehydrogenase E2 component (dihydrolipoamide acetyltransferase)/2-oxoisovalerate dehydrogenase E2 component (dihydrolipoyl transacylase)